MEKKIHNVVAAIYEGMCIFELGIAADVFGMPPPVANIAWYQFSVCTIEKKRIAATGGLELSSEHDIEFLDDADMIIVPGWRDPAARPPQSLLAALRAAHDRRVRLVSFYGGSFILAAAGVLDGKRATTHWLWGAELATRHPRIIVQGNVLFTDDGDVMTSAGKASSLDLCLYIVRKDFGNWIARRVAQRMIMSSNRAGGQPQFSQQAGSGARADKRVGAAIARITRDLSEPMTIAALARLSNMSERTLLRRFRAATGASPLEWLIRERLEYAKQLLHHSDMTVDQVSSEAGFGSVEAFRRQFRRAVGVTPRSFRKAR